MLLRVSGATTCMMPESVKGIRHASIEGGPTVLPAD